LWVRPRLFPRMGHMRQVLNLANVQPYSHTLDLAVEACQGQTH
jgi:hypothetical protein